MKKAVMLSLLSSAYVTQTLAGPVVIYGEDNRTEVYEASVKNQKLARSAVTMISKYEMTRDARRPGLVQFNQATLRDWLESPAQNKSTELSKATAAGISFCDGTRFVDQPNPGMCSGFLIAPDLIVTAGHCLEVDNFCDEYKWVFDFQVDKDKKTAGVDVPQDNIYGCKKVVSGALVPLLGLDYGVVQLDRPVRGREPLEIATDKIADNEALVVIGSPSGLPLKVAAGAKVRTNAHPNFFVANLDTFQGNSGSAVFNEATGEVEGILVRGEEDYIPNFQKMCVEANVCSDSGCRGEDVSRMTSIPEVALRPYLIAAAKTSNVDHLNKILDLNIFVDFNTKDGKTALIHAAEAAQKTSLELLLAKEADVQHQDAKGNTALHALATSLSDESADALTILLNAGASLEKKNDAGETALLVAGRALNLAAAKLLIQAGADKNAVDGNGENVLIPFVKANNTKAVMELANLGVDTTEAMKIARNVMKLKLKLNKIVNN